MLNFSAQKTRTKDKNTRPAWWTTLTTTLVTTAILGASLVAAPAATAMDTAPAAAAGSGNAPAESSDGPSFLWRIDTRPPEEIFDKGFQPRNPRRLNLLLHHAEVDATDSGFVATTDRESLLPEIMKNVHVGEDQGVSGVTRGPVYKYKIRATPDRFFSVNNSLRWMISNSSHWAGRVPLAQDTLDRFGEAEREWVAVEGIPSSQIVEASLFHPEQGPIQKNRSYVPADTRASNRPYTDEIEEEFQAKLPPNNENPYAKLVIRCDPSGSGPHRTKREARQCSAAENAAAAEKAAEEAKAAKRAKAAKAPPSVSTRPVSSSGGKVQGKDLDSAKVRDRAAAVQKEILADKDLMDSLPHRTDKPMSAADLETVNTKLKAKLSSIRPDGHAVSGGLAKAGVGAGLYNVITTLQKDGKPLDTAKSVGYLIPVVGEMIGIADGVDNNDPETIAVNTIALAGLLVAESLPAVGEVVNVALIVYTVGKVLVEWWKTLDPQGKECAMEGLRSPIILFFPPCDTYAKQWATQFSNAVLQITTDLVKPGRGQWVSRGGEIQGVDDGRPGIYDDLRTLFSPTTTGPVVQPGNPVRGMSPAGPGG